LSAIDLFREMPRKLRRRWLGFTRKDRADGGPPIGWEAADALGGLIRLASQWTKLASHWKTSIARRRGYKMGTRARARAGKLVHCESRETAGFAARTCP
jgi:hypothetical protein